MADIGVSPSASYTVGADVIGTVGYQRVKVQVGVSGTAVDVSPTSPLPVQVAGVSATSAIPAADSFGIPVWNVGIAVTSGVPAVNAIGQPVWLIPNQTVNVDLDPYETTATPAANSTGVIVWAQPHAVTIQQGASVNVGGMATVGYTTTGAAVGTGVVVWLGASQTVHIDFDPYETTAQPAVAASAMVVRQVDFYATTATPAAAASGQVMWIANPQALVSTAVVADAAPGLAVRQVMYDVTTGAPAAASTGQIVRVVPGVSVTVQAGVSVTVVTQLGTQVVSVVPGVSVNVGNLATALVTATAVTTGTGLGVWIMNPTVVSVSVSMQAAPMTYKIPVIIRIAANAAVVPDTKIAFSVFAGSTGVVNTTSWVVPAGKTFEMVGGAIYAKTSAVISFAALAIAAETATASVSVTSTMNLAFVMPYGITAATAGFNVFGGLQDVAAGTSIGMLVLGGTTHSHVGGVIQGYLF